MKFPKKLEALVEAPKQAVTISIFALIFSMIAIIMVMSRNHGA